MPGWNERSSSGERAGPRPGRHPDLLAVIRNDGRFDTTNPAWQATLGWSEAELAATPFIDLVLPDDVEATKAVWADVVERRQPVLRFENRYRCKDGGGAGCPGRP